MYQELLSSALPGLRQAPLIFSSMLSLVMDSLRWLYHFSECTRGTLSSSAGALYVSQTIEVLNRLLLQSQGGDWLRN